MKKIVDDWRLIYKVCSLYYEDDMRQQEVSDGLSGQFPELQCRVCFRKEKKVGLSV